MISYKFIGWCKEGVHDKVWGVIDLGDSLNGQMLTFWGRRGKKLQTLVVPNNGKLADLIRSKQRVKNYQSIDSTKLDSVYPEFQSDLEKTAIWATLKL